MGTTLGGLTLNHIGAGGQDGLEQEIFTVKGSS